MVDYFPVRSSRVVTELRFVNCQLGVIDDAELGVTLLLQLTIPTWVRPLAIAVDCLECDWTSCDLLTGLQALSPVRR